MTFKVEPVSNVVTRTSSPTASAQKILANSPAKHFTKKSLYTWDSAGSSGTNVVQKVVVGAPCRRERQSYVGAAEVQQCSDDC